MRLVAVGYSTVEAVPLFHVAPGGSALRLIVAGAPDPGVECDWAEACSIYRASISDGVEVDASRIARYASRWRVDVIILEGAEPLDRVGEAGLPRGHGALLGARTMDPLRVDPSGLDFILVDHMEPIGGRVPTHRLVRGLDRLAGTGLHLEVATYLDEPRFEEIIPLVEAAGEYPLHVFIRDPSRGLHSFMDRLFRRAPFSYIHAGPHSRLDTRCPRCGAILLAREHGRLAGSSIEDGRCPRCGAVVPVLGRVYESTPDNVYMVSRGATEWLHPARLG